MVSKIYPSELQLNKANRSRILDLHLSISNDIVSTKIHDKHDDFAFEIEEFPIIGFYLYHVTSAVQSSNWTTSGILSDIY